MTSCHHLVDNQESQKPPKEQPEHWGGSLIDLFLSLCFISFSRIHTHPVQRKSKWVRKRFLCVSWQFRSMLDQSQKCIEHKEQITYNVCHYLNDAILAMSLLSDIEFFSYLFMLKKHSWIGHNSHLFQFTRTHAHFHRRLHNFQHIHGRNLFLCFLIIWEFHSRRLYVQSTWLL